MEKLVYLIQQPVELPGPDLRAGLVEEAAAALRKGGAMQISISLDDEDVAAGSGVLIRRSDPPIRACVAFWLHNADDRAPCEDALARRAVALEGYLVVESRPLLHSPPLGVRAPGMNLVTCLKRRPDISEDEFIHRWHDEHKVLANEIQSTFGYVRNVVVRPLSGGGAKWDGVVEESFPIAALTDPKVWYDCDSDDERRRRARQMLESVQSFLDLASLESTPMSEYFLG